MLLFPGQKDVHDENYRKVVKLDVSDFYINFNLARSGLLEIIRSELLDGQSGGKEIEGELCKLNVYGRYFSGHIWICAWDYILPLSFRFLHGGGALVLRHNRGEWTFDSIKVL
jgi:hypothetical protein